MIVLIIVATIFAQEAPIHIGNIQSLTLRANELTNYRRVAPVPQLVCTGYCSSTDLLPKIVQCTNVGTDGAKINWKCEADLDKRVKFGTLKVQCEGFHKTGDDWVLPGSCSLTYELTKVFTFQSREPIVTRRVEIRNTDESEQWAGFLIGLVVVSLLLLFVVALCLPMRTFRTEESRYVSYGASDSFSTGLFVGSALSRPSTSSYYSTYPSTTTTTYTYPSTSTRSGYASTEDSR